MFSEKQIKTIVSESSTEVVAAIAGQDIAPKDIAATGSITGSEIIEDMTGYTFVAPVSSVNRDVEIIYAGVVKNGNKITFVVFGKNTMLNEIAVGMNIGQFIIPSAVAAKLYPYNIGGLDVLDNRNLTLTLSSSITTSVTKLAYIQKSDNAITFNLSSNGLEANKEYVFRYEQTFLLSDNLAE